MSRFRALEWWNVLPLVERINYANSFYLNRSQNSLTGSQIEVIYNKVTNQPQQEFHKKKDPKKPVDIRGEAVKDFKDLVAKLMLDDLGVEVIGDLCDQFIDKGFDPNMQVTEFE